LVQPIADRRWRPRSTTDEDGYEDLVDELGSKAVLLKLGVPESEIEYFSQVLRNTHQETLELRAWGAATPRAQHHSADGDLFDAPVQ
jgi:hypothetical protein